MHKQKVTNRRKTGESALVRLFNDAMYGISMLGAFLTLPQLIQIWTTRHTAGLSLLTWAAYAALSTLWLIYGVIHKEKQIVLAQALLAVVDLAVVIGILTYH